MENKTKHYLAPCCEEILVRIESAMLGTSIVNSGAKSTNEVYDEETI